MPFRKVGPDTYRSPEGHMFTGKQVRLYYASDGFRHMTSNHATPRDLNNRVDHKGNKKEKK